MLAFFLLQPTEPKDLHEQDRQQPKGIAIQWQKK
jgi:hypothetical protein